MGTPPRQWRVNLGPGYAAQDATEYRCKHSAANVMATQKERMTKAWKIAAEICEREAA
jgi:hypothetical protein